MMRKAFFLKISLSCMMLFAGGNAQLYAQEYLHNAPPLALAAAASAATTYVLHYANIACDPQIPAALQDEMHAWENVERHVKYGLKKQGEKQLNVLAIGSLFGEWSAVINHLQALRKQWLRLVFQDTAVCTAVGAATSLLTGRLLQRCFGKEAVVPWDGAARAVRERGLSVLAMCTYGGLSLGATIVNICTLKAKANAILARRARNRNVVISQADCTSIGTAYAWALGGAFVGFGINWWCAARTGYTPWPLVWHGVSSIGNAALWAIKAPFRAAA